MTRPAPAEVGDDRLEDVEVGRESATGVRFSPPRTIAGVERLEFDLEGVL